MSIKYHIPSGSETTCDLLANKTLYLKNFKILDFTIQSNISSWTYHIANGLETQNYFTRQVYFIAGWLRTWLTIKPSNEVIDEDVNESDTVGDEDAGKIMKFSPINHFES